MPLSGAKIKAMVRVLLLALCSAASLSLAQSSGDDQPPPGDYEDHSTYVPEPPGIEEGTVPVSQNARAAPPPPAPPAKPHKTSRESMEEIRTDWIAAVELFVDQSSVQGVWSARDLQGNDWRLKLVGAREETVRQRQPGFYAGLAAFKTVGGRPHRLDVEFVVDFTGAEPTVKQYVIKKIDGRPSR